MKVRLNLHIIKDELAENYQLKAHLSNEKWCLSLSHAQICDNHPVFSSQEVVYIVDASTLPSTPLSYNSNVSFICTGVPPKYYLETSYQFIYISEKVSLSKLVNDVLTIFQKYRSWQDTMYELIENESPIEAIGKSALHFLNNPILVQGPAFKILFHVFPKTRHNSTELYKKYVDYETFSNTESFSNEEILLLSQWEDFNSIPDLKHPQLLTNPYAEYQSLSCPLKLQGQSIGYVCVDIVNRPLLDGDYGRILILTEHIALALKTKYYHTMTTHPELEQVLQRLLNHILVPEKKIIQIVKHYKWNIEDEYICMCLHPILKNGLTPHLQSMAANIAKSFQNDFVIVHNKEVVFIVNLTQFGETAESTLTWMKTSLRDNLLVAGVSDVFYDFKKIYFYYQQAAFALKTGHKQHPTFWYFKFSDYLYDYLLQKYQHEQTAEAIVPDGLKRLFIHDEVYGTSYSNVLKVYLQNDRSISQTIKICYIHRNTFLNWLKKINEIIGMDLDDYKTRIILLLGFEILEKNP